MQIDMVSLLEEMLRSFGVRLMHINRHIDADAYYAEFDHGLRKSLNYPLDIPASLMTMEKHYEEKILYIMRDSFEEYYLYFRLPKGYWPTGDMEFIQIGPYIMKAPEQIVEQVIGRKLVPAYFQDELREYYYSIPLLSDPDIMRGIVLTWMGCLFQDREGIRITLIEDFEKYMGTPVRAELEDETPLSVAAVEKRYRCEEKIMDAVRSGDMERATEAVGEFQHYRVKLRSSQTLRDAKNLVIVLNTLLRKAVEEADVHPVYIDRVSENFGKQIENCAHVAELQELERGMIRKYCLLVQNHSLRGYSQVVRDTLNYIDFHITDPLPLKVIAEQVNVSPNYLCSQFKKEVGKTMTDYVNEKRIHDSMVFLAATDLSIADVAARVGIYDENYYARLFKKYQGQTAKQYRTMMKMKQK